MIYTTKLLNDESVDKILKIYDLSSFAQGVMTNPRNFLQKAPRPDIKNVLTLQDVNYQNECKQILTDSIFKSQEFYDYTCPKNFDSMKFLNYETGMYYKTHNDHYMMGSIRSDYSCTVFLSNPDEYDGGELVVNVGNSEIPYKLKKGEAVIYPTGLMHRVDEVLSGSRKVVVFWVESCIQDSRIRSLYQQFSILESKHREFIQQSKDFSADLSAIKYNMLRSFLTL